MRTQFLVLVLLLFGAVAPSWGASRVNTSSSADRSSVLPGPNGEWVVVFHDSALNWALARMDRDGNRTFGPVELFTGGPYPFDNVTVSNGNRIGWAYVAYPGSTSEIWFHTMDFDGNVLSAPVAISPAPRRPCCPSLEWVGDKFVISYVADVTGGINNGIAARLVDGQGTVLGPELTVLPETDPAVVGNPQAGLIGDVIVASWKRENPDGLWAATINDQGVVVASPRLLDAHDSTFVRATQSLTDGVVIYYRWTKSNNSPTPAWQITLDDQAAVMSGPTQLGETFPYTVGIPFIAPTGHGVGVFHQYNPGSVVDVYMRRANLDATVGSGTLNVSYCPVEAAPSGNFGAGYSNRVYAVTWEDYRDPGPDSDVYFATAPAYDFLALGPGPDPAAAPLVEVRQPDPLFGSLAASFTPYSAPGFGANVGAGSIDQEEIDRVLTGPGPGEVFGPQVRAFAWEGTPLAKVNFYAYGTLKFGVGVASASLDGDASQEIMTGAGPGAVFGPHVRGWNYDGQALSAVGKVSFFAYSTLRYGVNVASGDVDGDGFGELLTGPGPGALFGSQLRGFQYDDVQVAAMSKVDAVVYAGATHGLHVGSGDLDDDRVDEIACGPGPSALSNSELVLYDYWPLSGLVEMAGSRFEAFPGAVGGARVATVQAWDVDFHDELLASRGPVSTSSSEVKAFDDSVRGFAALGSVVPFSSSYGSTMTGSFSGF